MQMCLFYSLCLCTFVQEVVRNFVDEVKNGLRQRMTTRDWLDDTTRHLSIEKVILEINYGST